MVSVAGWGAVPMYAKDLEKLLVVEVFKLKNIFSVVKLDHETTSFGGQN